jgi:hypothetical protein
VFRLDHKRIYTFGIIENPGKHATSLHTERFVFTSSSKRNRDRYRRLDLTIEGKEPLSDVMISINKFFGTAIELD